MLLSTLLHCYVYIFGWADLLQILHTPAAFSFAISCIIVFRKEARVRMTRLQRPAETEPKNRCKSLCFINISSSAAEKVLWRLKRVAFGQQHPMWDQNPLIYIAKRDGEQPRSFHIEVPWGNWRYIYDSLTRIPICLLLSATFSAQFPQHQKTND